MAANGAPPRWARRGSFLLRLAADEPGMARTRPCRACKNQVSTRARTCPACGDPLKPNGNPIALAAVMLCTLVAVIAMAVPRTNTPAAQPAPARPAPPRAAAPATDAQIIAAIKGSDDLEQHQTALVAASRAFMAKGGTLADLREMGGWVRSQTHKPRGVYFTYKRPGTNVRDRWYYDVDRGQLFQ